MVKWGCGEFNPACTTTSESRKGTKFNLHKLPFSDVYTQRNHHPQGKLKEDREQYLAMNLS